MKTIGQLSHGPAGPRVVVLPNGRRYRITDTGQPYADGEYPRGGFVIDVWHPPAGEWRFVSHSPDGTTVEAFLNSAARLEPEGTQWRKNRWAEQV